MVGCIVVVDDVGDITYLVAIVVDDGRRGKTANLTVHHVVGVLFSQCTASFEEVDSKVEEYDGNDEGSPYLYLVA